MNKSDGADWPTLGVPYTDEFGNIEPEVYRAAGALWKSHGGQFADSTIHDVHQGLELMLKAAAGVSRIYHDPGRHIENLPAYLFKTYKRLVLAELEKQNGHRKLEEKYRGDLAPRPDTSANDLDRRIEFQRLYSRMDTWMRDTVKDLILGYSFDEIGRMRGENPRSVRNKYNRKLKRLLKDPEGG